MASSLTERTPLLNRDEDAEDPRAYNVQSPTASTPNSASFKRTRSEGEIYQRHAYAFSPSRADQRSAAADQMTALRARYYSRLDPTPNSRFMIPNHVVPSDFYIVLPLHYTHTPEGGNQPSIITIFSIWNTMMGTSILSMPWAVQQAGLATGILLVVLMATLTTYTAYRVIRSPSSIPFDTSRAVEFSDVCRHHLGRFGEMTAVLFSFAALLGAAIVYWVLMTNFLYHVVTFIHDHIVHIPSADIGDANETTFGVVCVDTHHTAPSINTTMIWTSTVQYFNDGFEADKYNHTSLFNRVWHEQHTVPFFLVPLLGGLVNMKSAEFFTNFNALGTVSVLFILTFVSIKAGQWGINVNFQDKGHFNYIPQFRMSFPALSGMLSLAYFIHNCIISIMRNQRHPEHNSRDLCIAYFLVMFTYLFIGITYYVTFPLPKDCIADNLLNNFFSTDLLAFLSRCFLLVQMFTVFPLLLYILRIQFMTLTFKDPYPSCLHVVVMNAVVMMICIVFAVFLPQIGQIIRFVGALAGFSYLFTLPCLVYLKTSHANGQLTTLKCVLHGCIIALGFCNLIAQFAIL